MSDLAITAEHLSKQYHLGHHVDLTRSFRETVMDIPRQAGRRLKGWLRPSVAGESDSGSEVKKDEDEILWALRDVSFEVRKGEVLGIIGQNGAGKSTLMKVLSRVTWPTEGRAVIRGRVRSLLEVGTGFHPELTGRENIYLNGAILGMRKAEIARKFDEIVAFSEVERFLDTPVKRFSSGMYVRLAFAVAAHLESEILMVDEVLAVGDAQFQAKCLGKIQDVVGHGRTVLFISHNMQAIRRLCSRALLLKGGQLVRTGEASAVVDEYLTTLPNQPPNVEIVPAMHQTWPAEFEVFRIEILNRQGVRTDSLLVDEPFSLRLSYRVASADRRYGLLVVVRNSDGVRLSTLVSTYTESSYFEGVPGRDYRIRIETCNPFLAGAYMLDVVPFDYQGKVVDRIEGIRFTVVPVSASEKSRFSPGHIHMDSVWSLEAEEAVGTKPL
ncbi:MAG TPA: ABC transporter ATP-binding protein [Candidatus Sumerlaeota bacterium]|nr:ABC transporter ATP-binding protein [Candidatus Sumerlaeota bacterium]